MLFISLEHIVLEIWEQSPDLRVHHLILDESVYRQQLDYLPDDLGLLFERLVARSLELPEQAADLLMIGLQQHNRIRRHQFSFDRVASSRPTGRAAGLGVAYPPTPVPNDGSTAGGCGHFLRVQMKLTHRSPR